MDQVENKIKTIFADIPAAVNPQPKVLHKIPSNVEPIIGILTDPEMTSSSIEVMWKSEPMPKELMNTDVAFMMDLIKMYVRLIMSERFTDITSQPDAPFLGGSFYISNLCNSCDATTGSVSFKEGDAVNAFTAFMTELEKMKRFGFTEGEVQRAKDNIISNYERRVEAAPTRKNAEFVYPLLYNFYDNEPYMVNGLPTNVHWMNYWSDDIIDRIGLRKIKKAKKKFEQFDFNNGIIKLKSLPINANNVHELEYQAEIKKLLLPLE